MMRVVLRCWLIVAACLLGHAGMAHAQARLGVVKPAVECGALARAPLAAAAGAAVSAQAKVIDTPKGQFCQVTGTIAPAIGFEVDLPVARWTQRFLQSGCGGLCGSINASIGNAGTCRPALDGEFVVAASDLGHQGGMGAGGSFADDPQKRIDFAYRANHLTALVAKALIRAYYGQKPRYSYFSGCSDGGREALMEAQRYPDDFDGISAGAPAMLFQTQNSFWQAWTQAANLRADGSRILTVAKMPALHAAVIAHCDTLDGVKDGLLTEPRACKVDPAWVRCADGAADTSNCLTAEEWTAVAKLYAGPTDAAGNRFMPGGAQPGSELMWGFLRPNDMAGGMLASMSKVVLADWTPADAAAANFAFTPAQFERVNRLHGLNDATDPDLTRFAARGGRLVMWHGLSDTSIAPTISIAYYKAVQQQMGTAAADRMLRLFMLPGVGHCGGGDGFAQVDTLSPLMAWVESGVAPDHLVAERIPDRRSIGAPPANGADGRTAPAAGAAQANTGRPAGGPPGGRPRDPAPYAPADEPALASRPIYPFPKIARYTGSGDPAQAASYVPADSPVRETGTIDWYGTRLIAPGFQKQYRVVDGALAVAAK